MNRRQGSAKKDNPKEKRQGPLFRCFFESLTDDPTFSALSAEAKLVYFILTMKLGPSGIDVFYPEVLPRLTSLTADKCESAVAELRGIGWLQLEGNLAWLVHGLRNQPSYTLGNENHRIAIERHLRSLPLTPIILRFAEHYTLTKNLGDHLSQLSHPPSHPPPHRGSGDTKEEIGTTLSITGERTPECKCGVDFDERVGVCDECHAELPF